jgi:ABC-2 type transport system permease protein
MPISGAARETSSGVQPTGAADQAASRAGPRKAPRVPPPAFLAQLRVLVPMQLANWRWAWRRMLVLGSAVPLASMLLLATVAKGTDPARVEAIFVGSILLSLMFETQNKVASHFTYLHATRGATYFATLPVAHAAVVLATTAAFLLLALPPVALTIAAGQLVLHLRLSPSPWLLLAIPACATSLSGIGALIGTTARTPEEASALSQAAIVTLLVAGPVMFPADLAPTALRPFAYVNPAVFAASALRQCLFGPVTLRLAGDIGVLCIFAVSSLWVVGHLMSRQPLRGSRA